MTEQCLFDDCLDKYVTLMLLAYVVVEHEKVGGKAAVIEHVVAPLNSLLLPL